MENKLIELDRKIKRMNMKYRKISNDYLGGAAKFNENFEKEINKLYGQFDESLDNFKNLISKKDKMN